MLLNYLKDDEVAKYTACDKKRKTEQQVGGSCFS